jgi:hypothetical protein
VFDLWEFYVAMAAKREARAKLQKNEHNIQSQHQDQSHFSYGKEEDTESALATASGFIANSLKSPSMSKKVYIKELILGYMKISLSYFKSPRNVWYSFFSEDETIDSARYQLFLSPIALSHQISEKNTADDAFTRWSENTALVESDEVSLSTINIISAIVPSISEASIRFHGKLIEHVFESRGDVWSVHSDYRSILFELINFSQILVCFFVYRRSLRSHYSAEALKQLYKIIGSLDLVGNPTMLLTSFRRGLRDFILQPSRLVLPKSEE